MPPQKMAVVRARGEPNRQVEQVLPALYGAVFALKSELRKKGVAFKVGPLRARWPDAHLLPREQWTGVWALPVPEDTEALPQKKPGVEVRLETWGYGNVAQVLHVGPYSEEGPTVAKLREFIAESGYEVDGDHEEEYLTRPDARVPKTLIRYTVKEKR